MQYLSRLMGDTSQDAERPSNRKFVQRLQVGPTPQLYGPLSSWEMWKSRYQGRYRFPNVVDDRLHIGPRFVDITLPIREGLVQVEDGDFLAERHLVEKRNSQPKLFVNKLAVT